MYGKQTPLRLDGERYRDLRTLVLQRDGGVARCAVL